MDPFPYNSTCDDAGKEFFVRNIPVNFIDWDLFHIFYKYGTVHNVKIPEKQTMATKYGNSLRKLQVVDDTLLEKKYDEEPNSSKIEKPWLGVKCYSQDLPLKTPTKVRVVESPYPCRCVEDGFVFHIIPDAQQLGEEYADLQRTMNQFCSENPNLQDLPMIGQYALFGRSNIAYRAVCIGDMTMYLVDTGEIVPMELSHLWSFDVAFLELPTLIIPCGISDIAWIEPSVASVQHLPRGFKTVVCFIWERAYGYCYTLLGISEYGIFGGVFRWNRREFRGIYHGKGSLHTTVTYPVLLFSKGSTCY
ncbi:hypothetical protein KIN20_035596 [Parelaphostrongylus tenuis]|uniref:Tudor domain-containing protein n=1 Tax=Parelaphostrongylus tenuis TaxID=148309 RepID=A0AAD5WKK0_PARTN|nr:hypothetical protein KIN20_035596 [Parelaphostrongylus tenuis]